MPVDDPRPDHPAAAGGDGGLPADPSLAQFLVGLVRAHDPSPPAGTPRERLGPYVLTALLGSGGQGHVHEALDERIGRRVALKLLPAGVLPGEPARTRFRREAELLSRLDHPGVATVYEAGEADGCPYLAMRLVEGESLARRLARDGCSPVLAATLIEKTARALHAAHELGVVHRDVKPANILVTADDEPVVIDFGLARDLDGGSVTQSGEALGTPGYMAPEQVRGDAKSIDARSDVYSLGVVLFECLASRPPFRAPTRDALYRAILESDPPDLLQLSPACPRDLAVVVETCLEKEPVRRYQSALDLAEELARVRRREPILARKTPAVARLWRWAQRRPLVASLAAATAALLAVVAAGSLFYALEQKDLADRRQDLVVERTRLAEERAAESAHQAELRREAETRLYAALVGQARGLRMARQPGYRDEARKLLAQAATLVRGGAVDVPPDQCGELREEALASMADFIAQPLLSGAALEAASLVLTAGVAAPTAPPPATDGPWALGRQGKLFARSGKSSREILLARCEESDAGPVWRELGAATSELWIVRALAFTGREDRLAAACEGGLLVLDVPGLQRRCVARGPVMGALACQPNGSLLALLGSHQPIGELWDLDAGRLLCGFTPPPRARRAVFTGDGERLLLADVDGIPIVAMNAASTPERRRLAGGDGGVVDVRFSPDGGRLLACASKDGVLRLWSTESGTLERALRHVGPDIQCLDFSRDGRFIAVGGWSGHVAVFELSSGSLLASADGGSRTRKLWAVRFARGGTVLIAGGDAGVKSWRMVESGGGLGLVPASEWAVPGVYGMEVTLDGAFAALLRRGPGQPRVDEIELATGAVRALREDGVLSYLFGISLDASGQRLYFSALDGRLVELERETGRTRAGLEPGSLVDSFRVFSPGRLVAKGIQGSRVRILTLDPDLLAPVASLELPAEPIDPWSFDLSPDGRYLALGLATGDTALWDLDRVEGGLSSLCPGASR